MYRTYNRDALLIFKDAGAITADAAAQVGGVDRIVTLGDARWEAMLVIDVTAVDATTGDETQVVIFQLSDSATFASGVVDFARMPITATGRHEFPVMNVKAGVKYTYGRIYTDVGGTTPSVNYTVFAAVLNS